MVFVIKDQNNCWIWITSSQGLEMEMGGEERKRVVVIGGGVAGSLLAKSLQFNSDFTLIDQYASFSL